MTTGPKRILILGGGFAGVYTARYLEKLLRPEQASIRPGYTVGRFFGQSFERIMNDRCD